MVSVFLTFALSGPLPPKEMGVILGLAVLLDAALVRLILLPVMLRLLGKWAWYLPKPLKQATANVRFGHASSATTNIAFPNVLTSQVRPLIARALHLAQIAFTRFVANEVSRGVRAGRGKTHREYRTARNEERGWRRTTVVKHERGRHPVPARSAR